MSGESRDVWELLDDAIENTLYEHESFDHDSRCRCGAVNNMDGDVLTAHRLGVMSEAVRATLRDALTVTTREELDALPDDAVVLVDDCPARKHLGDWYFANDDGAGYGSESLALYLPALVLYRPDGDTP